MSTDTFNAKSIRTALRALQRGTALGQTSLTQTAVVHLRLLESGLEDTPASRELALFHLLEEIIRAQLVQQPNADGAREPVTSETGGIRDQFHAADIHRQAWLLLCWHHLDEQPAMKIKDLATLLGLSPRTLTRRLDRGYTMLASALAEAERASPRAPEGPGPARARILNDERARSRELIDILSEMLSILRNPGAVARFTREQLERASVHPATDVLAYRLGRIACWSRPEHQIHVGFTSLQLLVDGGKDRASGRWQPEPTAYASLATLLDERTEPLLVLLGPPGAGKSSLLRHLELTMAESGIRTTRPRGVPLTYLVPLGQYRSSDPGTLPPSPQAWLETRWALEHPHMPPLADLLASGQLLLLLDGLNEIPSPEGSSLREQIGRWKHFLHSPELLARGNRAVIACRSLDYSSSLSTPELGVPQAHVEPMSNAQLRAALDRLDPAGAESRWRALEHGPMLELLRSPFLLRIYMDLSTDVHQLPSDSASLLTAWIRVAARRELIRDNPVLKRLTLLSKRDRAALISDLPYTTRPLLPEEGSLFRLLARLAFRMQSQNFRGEARALRVEAPIARSLIDDPLAETVLLAGEAIGVLDEDRRTGVLGFVHQRLQEYFAARALTREPDLRSLAEIWHTPSAGPGLAELLELLGSGERLPELPQSGWEETLVLTSGMSDHPDELLAQLLERNLALAGRCAAEGGLAKRCAPALLDRLRWDLVERSRDPSVDLRERIHCARSCAEIEDPRLRLHQSSDGAWMEPEMIEIPAGVYAIGSDQPVDWHGHLLDEHCGRHQLRVGAYAIGRHAVSNAEWARFIEAGGYEDPRWWPGETGEGWRSGRLASAGQRESARDWRRSYLRQPELLEGSLRQGSLTQVEYDRWRVWLRLSDESFEAQLAEHYPVLRASAPAFWSNARFNHPSQPVVGISWFEARAYCLWLSALSGQPFRLPTEVEWEVAARGPERWRFPCGEQLDPLAANTIAAHLFKPSPGGVFPESDSPLGVSDLAGNTWDWTSSAYSHGEGVAAFGYPYSAEDGRENPDLPISTRWVVRGGSWFDAPGLCAAFIRGSSRASHPGRIVGIRLALGASPAHRPA